MRLAALILLLPAILFGSKPDWLIDLQARKSAEPRHVDVVVVPQPADSVNGYWTVTHERVAAERRLVPVISLRPEADTPTERLITIPERIIHRWAWVEVPALFQGNTQSLIFHKEGCRYWDCANCTQYFATIEQALDAGYRACGTCKPEEAAE